VCEGELVLETSTNLHTWLPLITNVAAGDEMAFANPINPDQPAGFFRAVLR